jgi:hypothetical protein
LNEQKHSENTRPTGLQVLGIMLILGAFAFFSFIIVNPWLTHGINP